MTPNRRSELRAIAIMLPVAVFIVLAILLAWGHNERAQCYAKAREQGVVARWSLAAGCVMENAEFTGPRVGHWSNE